MKYHWGSLEFGISMSISNLGEIYENSSTQHSHGGTTTLRNSQHRELGINSLKESHKTPDLETHI